MFTVYTDNLEKMLDENLENIGTIALIQSYGTKQYHRNEDAEQLFKNVFGVRPTVFCSDMYHDCGNIVSEHGTMLVYVGSRMIKMYGGDCLFMDVQGK